jgi:WD40 repeat protein
MTLFRTLVALVVVGTLTILFSPPILYGQELTEIPEVVQDVEWSPTGSGLFLTGRGRMGVWGLWLFDTNLQFQHFFQFENAISADWSPNGTRLSMGRNIVDAQTLELLVTLDASSGIGGWSPDSSQVLAWAENNVLALFDATTGELVRTLPVGDTMPDAVSWSPDGQLFAILLPTGETQIISAEDGRYISSMPMEYPLGLRWSPDSTKLAAGFLEEVAPDTPNLVPGALSPLLASLRVWDVKTGTLYYEYAGLPRAPQVLRWGKHGNELVITAPHGILFLWHLDENLLETRSVYGGIGPVTYSPDGGRLIIGASTFQRDLITEQPEYRTFTWSQPIIPTVLEVIVPVATLDRFTEIAAACGAPAALTALDTSLQAEAAIASEAVRLEAQLDTLPEGAIPAGCEADLRAIAQAMQTDLAATPTP